MRIWSLPFAGPLSLRLAADVRLGPTDYVDDHIWELVFDQTDPPAIVLQTSYGLRARTMRFFPAFGWRGGIAMDPNSFASPPVVCQLYPNYLCLFCRPFEDLEAKLEYWVPDSHCVAGRFTLFNRSHVSQQAHLQYFAVLQPGENPKVMSGTTIKGVTILVGQTARLVPVVFLTGGAVSEPVPFPSLAVQPILAAGESKAVTWVAATCANQKDSLEAVRRVIARPWEAEIARLDLVNQTRVEFETGDEEWDAVLMMSQKLASGCFVGPSRHLPHPSFVLTRLPECGYSSRGDGRDYDWQWDGQDAAHGYWIVSQILPISPELAKGIIYNFLHSQRADGTIDGKPGLAGQRNSILSIPVLATLSWRIYEHTEDEEFLAAVFPSLLEFLEAWFSDEQDRDGDGHPEWTHTPQTGFDDCPSFVRWHRWGQGLDITKAETPDLAAYLYRECLSLIRMAQVLSQPHTIPGLESRAARLKQAVEDSWSEKTSSYHYVDRDIHRTVKGEQLGEGRGEFRLDVDRTFDPPVRILIRCLGIEGKAQKAQVFLHGRGRRGRGRIERLRESDFQWFWDFGTATSEKTYAYLERVEVRGLGDEFELEIHTADYTYQDQSLLYPLWAGIPSPERADRIIRRTILDPERYWRKYGMPCCSAQEPCYKPNDRDGAGTVRLIGNLLLGEALVDWDYQKEAAELIQRIMTAIVHSLRTDKCFHRTYNADQLEGIGERDHIAGIAPVSLLLYTLGIRLISPTKIYLWGHNPFPQQVAVRWRGLEVIREQDRTSVRFPNGQRVELDGEEPRFVEQIP